jgi:hypothetical protein
MILSSFDWQSKWEYLFLPVICIFGFVTNLMNIAVLVNPKMKDISFKYLLAISISDLLYLLLLSYSFIVQCTDCILHNTYFTQFYDLIIFHYIAASLAIFCIFTEIFLSLIRYSVLKNNTYLQSFKYYLVLGFLLIMSFIYYLPLLFFKNISPIKMNNVTEIVTLDFTEYSQVKNSIGLSLYGQTTPIILQSIRIFLAVFVLTSINIFNAILFRKRYSNKIQALDQRSNNNNNK